MKLAFTTLGCPEWDMDTIVSKAVEYGFAGVDFRGYLGETKVYELPEFTSGVRQTAKRFADANLDVPCFSTSASAFCPEPNEFSSGMDELKRYAEICGYFRTPFLRIFGGTIGDTPRAQAVDMTAENLGTMLEAVEDFEVQLLIETHDDWIASHHIAAVVEKVNSGSLGVLWDTHHPYRVAGEAPVATCEALDKWIRYTHWKDSIVKEDAEHGYQLCLVGNGDIPLRDTLSCLRTHGYNGYLTLEWEKMWCPEIEEPDVAFPTYVRYMRKLMKRP